MVISWSAIRPAPRIQHSASSARAKSIWRKEHLTALAHQSSTNMTCNTPTNPWKQGQRLEHSTRNTSFYENDESALGIDAAIDTISTRSAHAGAERQAGSW